MLLLGVCVVALLIGGLRLATQQPSLPTGSSYSTDPDGARALFEWADALGANPSRVQSGPIPPSMASTTVIVLQPENMLNPAARNRLEEVPRQGGSLVVAGNSVPWLIYARNLGVQVETVPPQVTLVSTPDGRLSFPATVMYRLHAERGEPLLTTADGSVVGLRLPSQQGSLVVLGTPDPLLNAGLRNEDDARFVLEQVVTPAVALGLTFDESQHSSVPLDAEAGPITPEQLLFTTAPGGAILYAGVMLFAFLLLAGRRLGPPLMAPSAMQTNRAMYEQVQMLANLYRRAGQRDLVRATFSRHYHRRLERAGGTPPRQPAALAEAVGRIDQAQSETELVRAVGAAVDAD
jgi:hypothetical protein